MLAERRQAARERYRQQSQTKSITAGASKVRDLVGLGLLADDPLRLRATPAGRRVLNRLTSELLV